MLNAGRLPNPWGAETIVLPTVDSTNRYARELAKRGAPHGTVVLAERQTSGKGRLGRSFSSPPELGIYCSVILRPDAGPEALWQLTPMAAEAARRAIETATGLEPGVKWINDLVLGNRKLCGILTELGMDGGKLDHVVIGIGINCNQREEDFPEELRTIAVSLRIGLNRPVERETVIAALLEQLFAMSRDVLENHGPWMEAYKAHCITLGKDVQLIRAGEVRQAHVDGMDDRGALLVTLADGTKETVFSGEASVRGMYGYV